MELPKILVVDDVKSVGRIVDRSLKPFGMSVFVAYDRAQARNLLAQHPDIKLVLLDIMLSESDGYEVMDDIQRISKADRPKVCFMTGKREKSEIVKAIKSGAEDYLVKPVDTMTLVNKVHQLIGRSSPAEIGKLTVSLRAHLLKSAIRPDLSVVEISESKIVLRSTAAIEVGYITDINCATLEALTESASSLTVRALMSKKERHGLYTVTCELVGISEAVATKLRALVIRGEYINDSGH